MIWFTLEAMQRKRVPHYFQRPFLNCAVRPFHKQKSCFFTDAVIMTTVPICEPDRQQNTLKMLYQIKLLHSSHC